MRTILLFMICLGVTSASADCLPQYSRALQKVKRENALNVKGAGSGAVMIGLAGATAGYMVAGTAGMISVPAASTAGAIGVSVYLDNKEKDLAMGHEAVMEAVLGDGLVLRSLHKEVSQNAQISFEEVVDLLSMYNSNGALCTVQPLSYSELVELIELAASY